jgi:hypothetical protein
MVLGGIVLVHSAQANPSAMEKFKEADAITVGGPIQTKLSVFKELAATDCSVAGIFAQERMIEICSKGLYGEPQSEKDAIDYVRALTNQVIDKIKRITAFEILGVYYKKAGERASEKLENQDEIISVFAIEAEKLDNLKLAIQCFQRAHDGYPDKANKDRLTDEIKSINKLLAKRD